MAYSSFLKWNGKMKLDVDKMQGFKVELKVCSKETETWGSGEKGGV